VSRAFVMRPRSSRRRSPVASRAAAGGTSTTNHISKRMLTQRTRITADLARRLRALKRVSIRRTRSDAGRSRPAKSGGSLRAPRSPRGAGMLRSSKTLRRRAPCHPERREGSALRMRLGDQIHIHHAFAPEQSHRVVDAPSRP
jgi:hypothetical protein